MTARVPTARARRLNAGTAPGWARAARGSATIGASVPSKSVAISARRGPLSSASSPACPSGVTALGRCVTPTGSGQTDALPPGALGAQALDQRRVEGERLGRVDQLVEQLVVPGSRDVEHLGDGLFLDAR